MAKHKDKRSLKNRNSKRSTAKEKETPKIMGRKYSPQHIPSMQETLPWMLGLVVFGVGLYSLTFGYGFILDDLVFYTKNAYVKEGFNGIGKIFSQESMAGYFGEQKNLVAGGRYRPLSLVSFAMEYQLFGLRPGLSHAFNVLLYGVTGAMIYYICSFFWPSQGKRPWYYNIGLWSGLLFIAHPIHTEVVANIKGRDEIMTLLFSLWTLIAAFKAKKVIHYVWVALLFYLALLSKENAITFLVVIPAALYVFRRDKIENKEWTRLAISLISMIVLYLIQRYLVIGYLFDSGKEITELMNAPFVDMSVSEKFATIAFTLGKYIQLLIWPHPLSHDYYPYAIAIKNWSNVVSLISLLFYAALSVFIVVKFMKRSVFAFLFLFFIATLSIVSNVLITVGTTMNERFIYISSVAFAILIPYLFIDGVRNKQGFVRKIGLIIMAVMALLFAGLTINRIPAWNNSFALNRSAVAAYPNSARSNLFMGTALFKEADTIASVDRRKAVYHESREFMEHSLRIHPTYGNALKMKAGVAAKLYEMDRDLDALFSEFTEVIVVSPGTRYVHDYLDYLAKNGNVNSELVNYYYELGFVELGQNRGKYNWAAQFLNYGLTIDPNNNRILNALAISYDNLGHNTQANQYRARMK